MSRSTRLLIAALLALAAVFAFGFWGRPPLLAISVLPPLLLAIALWRRRTAAFWSGVLALGWFAYGVMEAWALSGTPRLIAAAVAGLALVIIACGNYAALKARFGGRPR